MTTTPKPMTRKGKPCKVLPDGAPRRMSDGKNAFRKMNAEQRATFLAWIASEYGISSTLATFGDPE